MAVLIPIWGMVLTGVLGSVVDFVGLACLLIRLCSACLFELACLSLLDRLSSPFVRAALNKLVLSKSCCLMKCHPDDLKAISTWFNVCPTHGLNPFVRLGLCCVGMVAARDDSLYK